MIACSNHDDFFVELVLFEVAVDCAVETEAGSVLAIGVELKDVSFEESFDGGCKGVACKLKFTCWLF